MANTAQARKRVRQAEKHRRHNASQRSRLRTHLKKVDAAIASGDKTAASDAYQQAVPVIDSSSRRGLIHANKAARHKSRMNQRIRQLG